MAANERTSAYVSYSMQEPSLRDQAPACLRRAGPLSRDFEIANSNQQQSSENPVLKEDAWKRDDSDGGSKMVKRQKPFPEMKPENYYEVKKSFFDRAWIQEQRDAQMAYLSNQRESAVQQTWRSEPVFER